MRLLRKRGLKNLVDFWLVKTVGVLVSAIGSVLISAGLRRRDQVEVPMLGIGSAAGLAGIDIAYVVRRRISPVYLLDALAEAVFVVLWGFMLLKPGVNKSET
jgi:hypothetical protein